MTRKNTTILALVVAALCGMGIYAYWRHSVAQAARLAQARTHLTDTDAGARLVAAETILQSLPFEQPTRLVQAEALLELGRYSTARQALSLVGPGSAAVHAQTLQLRADSFLGEAAEIISTSTSIDYDMISPRITALFDGADAARQELSFQPEYAQAADLIAGRCLVTRLALLALNLRGVGATILAVPAPSAAAPAKQPSNMAPDGTVGPSPREDATSARTLDIPADQAASAPPPIDWNAARVQSLEKEKDELNTRLTAVCARMLARNPADARPLGLLMRGNLLMGAPAKARQLAQRIVRMPRLDDRLAGEVAGELLNLDGRYALSITSRDIDLAGKILNHPGLAASAKPVYRLATADLALRQGHYAPALAIARAVLARIPNQCRALCQVGLALIGLQRPDEAIQTLSAADEYLHAASLRQVLGLAYLADGQTRAGWDMLQRSLEVNPNYLPAQLALGESYLDAGMLVEAQPYVQSALALAPTHPAALGLRARLLIEKSDSAALLQLLNTSACAPPRPPCWEDAVLAARMVLDDVPAVQQLARGREIADPADMLALLAEGWCKTDAKNRVLVAAVTCSVLLDYIDADPLRHAQAPDMGFAETFGMPSVPEMAAEIVQVARQRWPEQKELVWSALALDLDRNRLADARLELGQLEQDTNPMTAVLREVLKPGLENGSGSLPLKKERDQKDLDILRNDPRSFLGPWLRLLLAARPPGSADLPEALRQFLTQHPWSEEALVLALGATHPPVLNAQSQSLLDVARQINPQLADLVLWRLKSTQAFPASPEAVQQGIAKILADEPQGSELRCRAANIFLPVLLAAKQTEAALGLLESLAYTLPHRNLALRTAMVDMLLRVNRDTSAATYLTSLLVDPLTPPRWLDRLLARAVVLLPAARMASLLDDLLKYRSGEPILLVYKAQALAAAGDLSGAQVIVNQLRSTHPAAPRLLLVQAQLKQISNRTRVGEGGGQ